MLTMSSSSSSSSSSIHISVRIATMSSSMFMSMSSMPHGTSEHGESPASVQPQCAEVAGAFLVPSHGRLTTILWCDGYNTS